MLKVLKWLGIGLLGLIVTAIIAGMILSEKKPKGVASAEADELAKKMLSAINYEAWDSIKIIRWDFANQHQFAWDKELNLVQVIWGKYKVLLNTKEVAGKAYENGVELSGERVDKLVQTAWSHFCNDSFWLNAPSKIFDEGTKRSIVQLKDGREGLMVEYASGGVTPGDAYVWILNEQGLPIAWKMWVKMIPIGGVESTWEDWKTLLLGAKISTGHKIAGYYLKISHVEAGQDYELLGLEEDLFEPILP